MVYDIRILAPNGFPLPGASIAFIAKGNPAPLVVLVTDSSGYVYIDTETDGGLLSPGITARITSGSLEPFDIDVTRLRPDTEITLVEKTNNTKPLIAGVLLATLLIAVYKNGQ